MLDYFLKNNVSRVNRELQFLLSSKFIEEEMAAGKLTCDIT